MVADDLLTSVGVTLDIAIHLKKSFSRRVVARDGVTREFGGITSEHRHLRRLCHGFTILHLVF